MNTECDCFIQTSKRLIIIECKDKTDLKKEQRERHTDLLIAFEKLLPRENKPVYIELTNNQNQWNWDTIKDYLNTT